MNHDRQGRASRRCGLALTSVLLAPVPVAAADLNDAMNTMFSTLTNSAEPQVFQTARRGVLSGGNLYVRTPIIDERLVSFVPPSFKAGCGGVDFFGGSFSFINTDQFIALMKSIAANAQGYAFQLALSVLNEMSAGIIETMQKKVQQLNQFFGNSCQVAQGVVNDALDAFGVKQHVKASNASVVKGFSDAFEAFTDDVDDKSPTEKLKDADAGAYSKFVSGNVVWRALKRMQAQNWFVGGLDGDNEMLEVAMNLVGSKIVGDPEDAPDGEGKSPKEITVTSKPELLEAFIDGGQVKIQGCKNGYGEDECTEIEWKTVEIDGFRRRVEALLRGTATSQGVIERIGANQALSDDQKKLVGIIPGGASGPMIRIAKYGAAAGDAFARQIAPLVAMELAYGLARDLMKVVASAMAGSTDTHAPLVLRMHDDSLHGIRQEMQRLQGKYGSLPQVMAYYNDVIRATERHAVTDTAISVRH